MEEKLENLHMTKGIKREFLLEKVEILVIQEHFIDCFRRIEDRLENLVISLLPDLTRIMPN